MRSATRFALTVSLLLIPTTQWTAATARAADAPVVRVEAGESIQAAIDAAADGSVIELAEGTYPERLTIAKPLTLRGAGWDKTVIRPEKAGGYTQAQKDEFFRRLEAAASDGERVRLAMEIARPVTPPTVTVKSAAGVTLEKLKVQGPATASDGNRLSPEALVVFRDADRATMNDCAVVGPYMNGVVVTDGSSVDVARSLVAAMWGTGIHVGGYDRREGGDAASRPATLSLSDSEVRNCYHRGVTIAGDGTANREQGATTTTIARCRISGSAWHGIRYDGCSPTITDNHIFANARSGIYASGRTAATVRGNVFAKNEMGGMSCWFENADTIEGNTFVDNLREGVAVLGNSHPTLKDNVIARNPVGVVLGTIRGRGDEKTGPGRPTMKGNTFWQNGTPVRIEEADQPLPEGNSADEPTLDPAKLTPPPSPWPLQPEEKAIIPDGETRDFSKWKTTASGRR